MSEVDDFVHLHMHSDMSQLDGCGKIPEYVKVAKARGHKAVSFTDHGTMRGYMALHEESRDLDIKPIYGIEFYVSPDMKRKGLTDEEKADITGSLKRGEAKEAIRDYEDKMGIRDRWHTTAWAINQEGLKNLFRLSSMAFIEGFYYKPRIDIKTLIEYGEGIAIGSGCLSSPINDSWMQGKKKAAMDYAEQLSDAFGDRFYLEIQPHAIRDQVICNKMLVDLKRKFGTKHKMLVTQDAHYVQKEDAPHHDVLLCIGTGSNLSDPSRFKFDGDEFYMKTRSEMERTFRRNQPDVPSHLVKEGLDATVEFAERCSAKVEVDYHKALLPDPGIPEKYKGDHFAYFKDLTSEGWAWREIPRRAKMHAASEGIPARVMVQRYVDRVKHELKAIKNQGFTRYFLMVRDIYSFARRSQIMVGPGRGSVGGSLVAYLLGITSVDPIEHGLIFERFINPARVDEPDIDMDFEDRRRHEIMDYIRAKYGEDKVCQIATVGKLSGKQCLRDVSRVLEVPLREVDKVTKSIIERSSGDERASSTIEDSFKEFEVCKDFNKKYPKVLYHAKRLEGMAKNLGIHAAGIVASPVPLTDLMPLEIRKHDGKDIVVSAVDMYGVGGAGLVKLDVLGLRTLTVIKEALEAIEKRHGRKIDMENPNDVDLNDPKVLEGFTKHNYGGVFQYDTPSADKVCAGVEFTHFEDIAAMTALNRPGTSRSGLATEYVKRKKDPSKAKKDHFHPKVTAITSDTLGIIVYQEHVIKIFTELAGFPPGTADSLRKTIAKKVGDETMGKERENFIKGCKKHSGVDEKTAGKIMDAITFFGSYGFNKSHATEYGMIAHWCMWLKTYYPLEFYWSLMANEPDRIRIQQIAKDAKKQGIGMLPPHVNISDWRFSIDGSKRAIRGSLVDIKGCGSAASKSIIETQPYKNLIDFTQRVNRRAVHKGVVVALATAGALDGLIPNNKHFVDNIERWWKALTRKKLKKDELKELIAEAKSAPDYNKEDKDLLASKVSPLAFGKHPIDAYESFMKREAKVETVDMGGDNEETFFKDYDGKGIYVAGVIVEVKYNQIGDFHTGKEPSPETKKKMFWGARYANVNIEDRNGKQNRFKVDIDTFDLFRSIVDKGVGTPVICHCHPMDFTGTLRAHGLVNLETWRQSIEKGEPLQPWEAVVGGKHPAILYPWDSPEKAKERIGNLNFKKYGGRFTGMITSIREKYDRKDNLMATIGLIDGAGKWIEVICFASVWEKIRHRLRPFQLIRIELDRKPDSFRGKGWSHFYNGGRLSIFRPK